MGDVATDEDLIALLSRNGFARISAVERMQAAGGNNRIYVVDTDQGRVIAKRYFSSSYDRRDRRRAEWAFMQYAAGLGIRCIPRPIATDAATGITICEHIEGRRPDGATIDARQVKDAAEFFVSLNGPDRRSLGASIDNASEACFSFDEHLTLVETRIARLASIPPVTEEDRDALMLLGELHRSWNRIRLDVETNAGASLADPLPDEQRCISPSDFGFHNAIERPDGTLCFVDFEYAGWDDPAKMAADFFCQPALPVAESHLNEFIRRTMSCADDPGALEARVRTLLPVIQVKWCCIMLNQFLPDAANRRRFANPEVDLKRNKREQIEKVRRALVRINGNVS